MNNGWAVKRIDGWTEFPPILQDFVPCWGRCPATFCDYATSKKQGKGAADLKRPFGDWFWVLVGSPVVTQPRFFMRGLADAEKLVFVHDWILT